MNASGTKRVTWEELCRRVPELRALQDECLSVRNRPTGCAVRIWYGYDDGKGGIRRILKALVGWHCGSDDPVVSSQAAHDIAYRTLYESLPDCIGRCPACPDVEPRQVRDEFARLRPAVLKLLIRERGRLCEGCGAYLREPTIDHVIPVARGGGNRWDNFQLLCRPCNSRKGAPMTGTLQSIRTGEAGRTLMIRAASLVAHLTGQDEPSQVAEPVQMAGYARRGERRLT